MLENNVHVNIKMCSFYSKQRTYKLLVFKSPVNRIGSHQETNIQTITMQVNNDKRINGWLVCVSWILQRWLHGV